MTPDRAAIDQLTLQAGLGCVRSLVPLAGGANNRVFRVEAKNGEAVLKCYFRHPDDTRDRLGAEFTFAKFAWTVGVRSITEPLGCDPAAGLGLFQFVPGDRLTPSDVCEASIKQATEFIRDLNAARHLPLAARLPIASEACFSIAEHIGTVDRRIAQLTTISSSAARTFVKNELIPTWEDIRVVAVASACDSRLSLDRPLEPVARCVSPSDFGFHNALLQSDGCVRFIDFEYAGWDDPAKLVSDFFCQPAVPVPAHFFENFAHSVASCFPEPELVLSRARTLLPVYRVKWVCILLNEFLRTSGARRAFSLSATELEARKAHQLARARAALTALYHTERIST
jgi:hypothetical protein